MKILITGGAGYIGSMLTTNLIHKNFEVTVIDNFMYHQNSLGSLFYNKNLTVFNSDVRDLGLMKELINKNDVIIPLAAIVGAPACAKNPWEASSINKDSILHLLNLVSNDHIILMPTTNSAYGSGNTENKCDENSPLNPLSLYAKEKVEVEIALMSRSNSSSFRLATVFGMSPRMRLDLLVNDFVNRALNDRYLVLFESHFKRNYIHIQDVVKVFTNAIINPKLYMGEIFNVGLSSANLSKLELCKIIKEFLPNFYFTESNINKDPDQRNYIVSNLKIESTGFKPEYSIQDGISELIKGIGTLKTKNYTNLI